MPHIVLVFMLMIASCRRCIAVSVPTVDQPACWQNIFIYLFKISRLFRHPIDVGKEVKQDVWCAANSYKELLLQETHLKGQGVASSSMAIFGTLMYPRVHRFHV
jgi:hypothetical protein